MKSSLTPFLEEIRKTWKTEALNRLLKVLIIVINAQSHSVDAPWRLEWCTKFRAANAKRYVSVKQGDSWEPGSQNTERKQKRSLTEISQDPPTELLPMSTINQP